MRYSISSFHRSLRDGRGGPCHHFTAQWFLGPVYSLAASGKKTEKSAPQPLNPRVKTIPAAAGNNGNVVCSVSWIRKKLHARRICFITVRIA